MGQHEQTMKDKGIRLTWRRQAILDVFRAAEDLHLSAEGVLHELIGRKTRINATTVYRNLEMMALEGILNHVDFHDGSCRYELGKNTSHHHLHCTACGKLVEFDCNDSAELERLLSKETGFRIKRHQLEVFGLCPACH